MTKHNHTEYFSYIRLIKWLKHFFHDMGTAAWEGGSSFYIIYHHVFDYNNDFSFSLISLFSHRSIVTKAE